MPRDRIDAASLMRLRSLQLRARAVVEGFLAGLHRSPYHGFSAEFSEYREYTPGDDPRYLDWRLLARSDRYYVKRFEDETNLQCWLLVDLSGSMAFGTQSTETAAGSLSWTKADFARTIAATLAYFLSRQRDAVGLITFDESITEAVPARFTSGHLMRLLTSLERATGGSSTDVLGPLDRIAETVGRRGLIVLLTDLLAPPDGLRDRLAILRARGQEVLVLRVLDPREVDFAFDRPQLFRDAETGREFYVDPAAASAGYRERFAAHAADLQGLMATLGIEMATLRTDEPIEQALFELLAARMRQAQTGRVAGKAGAAGGRQ